MSTYAPIYLFLVRVDLIGHLRLFLAFYYLLSSSRKIQNLADSLILDCIVFLILERSKETVPSFWVPVTSTSEWCEKNYEYSPYIAEFFNTISNIPGMMLAMVGLMCSSKQRFEKRFSVLYLSNLILAVWNLMYHATLHRLLQQSDETPVVWETLLYMYILYSPDWHYRKTMPTFLILYGIVFAICHSCLQFGIGIKVHFVIICLLSVPRMYKYYLYTEDLHAKRVAKLYAVTLVLGSLCWLFDRVLCNDSWLINPQGHALWHVFMGLNAYLGNTFLMFCRGQQLRRNPKVVQWMGILPYVTTQKEKSL
ncbi:OLC1v1020831C1 [Oldenlandia corymbosa var. corymbosa]|uniref:OLC1v1020831C1 n=1 Tax=Oldenlandia corymbosa var. corymbosa TaxID=529605 RepID=A0AAV1BUC0_OLDCO|nr:OLC1v1020831C1 [Oldenlandia corymbosa var. corymbosa]